MDILFVAEEWVGKRNGQEVTAQHPTFSLVTEIGKDKVIGYVRKENIERMEVKGEGKWWTVIKDREGKQECIGIYIQPRTKKEKSERLLEEVGEISGEGDMIIMGEFNAHYPKWANKQANARGKAENNWAETEGLTLRNKHGAPTPMQIVQGAVKERTINLI